MEDYPSIKELQEFLNSKKDTKDLNNVSKKEDSNSDNKVFEKQVLEDQRLQTTNATLGEDSFIYGEHIGGLTIEEAHNKILEDGPTEYNPPKEKFNPSDQKEELRESYAKGLQVKHGEVTSVKNIKGGY